MSLLGRRWYRAQSRRCRRCHGAHGAPGALETSGNLPEVVDSDSAFLLRASRLAGLGAERDKSRLALLGKEVIILQVDGKDMTVQAGRVADVVARISMKHGHEHELTRLIKGIANGSIF